MTDDPITVPAATPADLALTRTVAAKATFDLDAASLVFEIADAANASREQAGHTIAEDVIRRTPETALAQRRKRIHQTLALVDLIEDLGRFDHDDGMELADSDRDQPREEVQNAWFDASGWRLISDTLHTSTQRVERVTGNLTGDLPVVPVEDLRAQADDLLTGALAGERAPRRPSRHGSPAELAEAKRAGRAILDRLPAELVADIAAAVPFALAAQRAVTTMQLTIDALHNRINAVLPEETDGFDDVIVAEREAALEVTLGPLFDLRMLVADTVDTVGDDLPPDVGIITDALNYADALEAIAASR